MLSGGDILEVGEMVDFDDGKRKVYEELWQDWVLGDDDKIAIALETEGGCVIRIGRWCQGIFKQDGVAVAERWWDGDVVFGDGSVCAKEVWEKEGKKLSVGQVLEVAGREWKVVERSIW